MGKKFNYIFIGLCLSLIHISCGHFTTVNLLLYFAAFNGKMVL